MALPQVGVPQVAGTNPAMQMQLAPNVMTPAGNQPDVGLSAGGLQQQLQAQQMAQALRAAAAQRQAASGGADDGMTAGGAGADGSAGNTNTM